MEERLSVETVLLKAWLKTKIYVMVHQRFRSNAELTYNLQKTKKIVLYLFIPKQAL